MLYLITIFSNLCLSKEMIVFQDVGDLFIEVMCKKINKLGSLSVFMYQDI
jgi:hypothetical protein